LSVQRPSGTESASLMESLFMTGERQNCKGWQVEASNGIRY
jgi:hypothetical protein